MDSQQTSRRRVPLVAVLVGATAILVMCAGAVVALIANLVPWRYWYDVPETAVVSCEMRGVVAARSSPGKSRPSSGVAPAMGDSLKIVAKFMACKAFALAEDFATILRPHTYVVTGPAGLPPSAAVVSAA